MRLELKQVKDYTKTIEPGFNVSTHFCMHTVRLLHSHFFQKDKTYQELKEIQVSETRQKLTVAVVFLVVF